MSGVVQLDQPARTGQHHRATTPAVSVIVPVSERPEGLPDLYGLQDCAERVVCFSRGLSPPCRTVPTVVRFALRLRDPNPTLTIDRDRLPRG
jgi:hypothetical protein